MRYGRGKQWRAVYVDDHGDQKAQAFDTKKDVQAWLNEITASQVTGLIKPAGDV